MSLPKTPGAFIGYFIKKQKWALFFIQITMFAWTLEETVFNIVFGRIIDSISAYEGDRMYAWESLKFWVLSGFGLWCYIQASYNASGFLQAKYMPVLQRNIRMDVLNHIQNQGYDFYIKHFVGSLGNKISDITDSTYRVMDISVDLLIPSAAAIIIATIMFFSINVKIAFLLVLWVFIHIGICFIGSPRGITLAKNHAEARSRLQGRIVDSMSNFLSVILFSGKRFEKKHIHIFQNDELRLHQKERYYFEWLHVVLGILMIIMLGFFVNYQAYRGWQRNEVSTGDIVILFSTSWHVAKMVWEIGVRLPEVLRDVGVCKQGMDLVKETISIEDGTKSLNITNGEIEFKNVDFQYNLKNRLFVNQSLVIEPKQKIGLMGYSGAGKSSFVNLILRLYDVQHGSICIDGQNVKTLRQNSLHEAIAVVPQAPTLFHRTIRENILYGNTSATDEEVIKAAKLAHAHNFIRDLENGYDTIVGERGVKLSGGQRQRIALARAFLKKSKIIILDEATSALDSKTEADIQDSIEKLIAGKTVIAIAHRLSTLKKMDRILVLDKGKIVSDGTHEELMYKDGIYKKLWNAQVGGYI